jgi:SNF2 family DNA or RNA helicase
MSPPPRVAIDGRGRLAVVNAFEHREAIKDLKGARYQPRTRLNPAFWWFPATPGAAAALLGVLLDTGAQVSPKVMALAQEESSRETRRAIAADESLPLPELPWERWLKTTPFPHQKRGSVFLRDSSAAALGMGMGTGKSLTVVAALNMLELTRVLVVCPVATLGVFPRELRAHSSWEWHTENGVRRTRLGTLRKLTLTDRWELITALFDCRCGRPHAAVIGYEALVSDPVASADMAALGVEVVVYDEAHRLKAAGGTTSKTAHSWVNQIPRRWALSGTLMPQTPDDIYGTYRALDPAIFGTNKEDFQVEYIQMGKSRDGKEYPKDVKRGKRLEFSQKFHSIAYVPVVDLKLPRATHTIRSFELEPAARRIYNDIRDTGIAEITTAVVAAGGSATPAEDERTVSPANAGVEYLRFAQITGGSVKDDNNVVSVVSRAKVTELAAVLDEVSCRKGGYDGKSRPEPVIVFCRFIPDLDAVEELCRKLGLRYGEVSGRRKDGIDDRAHMNPNVDLVAAQIAAGSQGIDFTRSRINVWYSVGFELWLFQQAQKRSDRLGQTRSVANYYLVAEETIDGIIYGALARKENVIDECTNAYVRHLAAAERPSVELPGMEVGEATVAGAPPNLPGWLMGTESAAPRALPDFEREEEQRTLALGGLEGF